VPDIYARPPLAIASFQQSPEFTGDGCKRQVVKAGRKWQGSVHSARTHFVGSLASPRSFVAIILGVACVQKQCWTMSTILPMLCVIPQMPSRTIFW
jgi:hypothetical protein